MLLTLLACTPEPVDEVDVGQVRVVLVNPTLEDPFVGVDALRVEVFSEEGTVQRAEFSLDEAVELPDLVDFGLVYVALSGLAADGELVSYGRTPEVLVEAGQDVDTEVLFLPVGRELLLDFPAIERAGHAPLPLDVGVALVGGGAEAVEVFDGAWWSQTGANVSTAAGAGVARGSDFWLVVGGVAELQGQDRLVREAYTVDVVDGTVTELPGMIDARSPGCASIFRQDFGLVLGTEEAAETLRRDPDSGQWEWTRVLVGGLDGRGVEGCVSAEDGRILMLGDISGVFDFRAETAQENPKIAEAFTPGTIPGELGGEVRPGVVWTDAGVEVELDNQSLRETFAPVDVAVEVVALDSRVAVLSLDRVELLDLETGLNALVDVTWREGARLSVLPEGTLFISGPDPALIQPRP